MSLGEVKDAVRTLTVDGDHVWDGQDEDDRPATEEEMRAAREAGMARREVLVHPGRTPVVLGVDTDVVEAFRAGGPDWRARMTAASRAWVDTHPAESPPGIPPLTGVESAPHVGRAHASGG